LGKIEAYGEANIRVERKCSIGKRRFPDLQAVEGEFDDDEDEESVNGADETDKDRRGLNLARKMATPEI
jgi:hypothetical protein